MFLTRFSNPISRIVFLLGVVLVFSVVIRGTYGQLDLDTPKEMEGVGIESHLKEYIPLDLTFTDDQGKEIKLSDYFNRDRPVLLTLNYYRCPQLCTLILNGMTDALNHIEWTAGKEFDIITASIDPTEGTELAVQKKDAYLTQYNRESVKDGWHFLTGPQESITALTDAVGFKYKLDPRTGQFAHTASIIFLTPEGRISLYMNDVLFDPKDVRLALVDASEGTIGSPFDKFILYTCFQYDPESGSFVPNAFKIMRAGGVLTMVLMGLGGYVLWKRAPKETSFTHQTAQNGHSPNMIDSTAPGNHST